MFPILIRRDDGQSQTEVACCEWKDSIPFLSPCLDDWRIILKDKNELSMQVCRESRSHFMVGETKKQDRNTEDLERGTELRNKDDVSLFNLVPYFAVQFFNKLRIGFFHLKVQIGTKIW